MAGKYFPWVIRRTLKCDRGNGTSKKTHKYLTFKGGWTKRSPKRPPGHVHPACFVSQAQASNNCPANAEVVNISEI